MFQNLVIQADDLQWLVPMVIGAVVFLIATAAMFLEKGWTVAIVATLATALIGAGVFQRVSLTKDGIIVETAKLSVSALESLEKASKANADAISKLSMRVDQLASATLNLSASQPSNNAAAAAQLKQISEEAARIQRATKETNELLTDVGKKNELIRGQINQITRPFRF